MKEVRGTKRLCLAKPRSENLRTHIVFTPREKPRGLPRETGMRSASVVFIPTRWCRERTDAAGRGEEGGAATTRQDVNEGLFRRFSQTNKLGRRLTMLHKQFLGRQAQVREGWVAETVDGNAAPSEHCRE